MTVVQTPDGTLVDEATGEIVTPPTPPSPPATPTAPSAPTVPVTPAQPSQAPPEQTKDEVLPGPAADVDRQLAADREREERAERMASRAAGAPPENAPPAPPADGETTAKVAKKPSRYFIAFAILTEEEAKEPGAAEKQPVAFRLWTGPPAEVSPSADGDPVVVEAHTQTAAKEKMLAQDPRALALAEAGRLWLGCIGASGWRPKLSEAVVETVRTRLKV